MTIQGLLVFFFDDSVFFASTFRGGNLDNKASLCNQYNCVTNHYIKPVWPILRTIFNTTVPADAGIEPRTVAVEALIVRAPANH
jgi:hypothetical protein